MSTIALLITENLNLFITLSYWKLQNMAYQLPSFANELKKHETASKLYESTNGASRRPPCWTARPARLRVWNEISDARPRLPRSSKLAHIWQTPKYKKGKTKILDTVNKHWLLTCIYKIWASGCSALGQTEKFQIITARHEAATIDHVIQHAGKPGTYLIECLKNYNLLNTT